MGLDIPKHYLANLSDNPLAHAFDRPGPDLALDRGSSTTVKDDGVLEPFLNEGGQPQAAYISLPFCASFCSYCGFGKVRYRPDLEERYVEALMAEIALEVSKPAVRRAELKAVYFGGGTPTVLRPDNIVRVLKAVASGFKLQPGAEITFEGRLSTLTQEKEETVWACGVNRFSIGIQSFDSQVRRKAGRCDNVEKITSELKRLNDQSHGQIVIDLMYGLPGQTLEIFKNDLELAASLGLDDLSVYQIKLMPKAPLKRMIEEGLLPPIPPMAVMAKYHVLALGELNRYGYRQTSAHHYTRHGRDKNIYNNLSLGRSDLLAYGLGAGGRLGGAAFGNTSDLDEYFHRVESGHKPLARFRQASKHQALLDRVSLMVMGGVINSAELTQMEPNIWTLAKPLVNQWVKADLIEEVEEVHRLTMAGLFWRGTMEAYLREWLEKNLT